MKSETIFKLSNGREITASQLSLILEITTRAARNRLNKYSDVGLIFKSTSELLSQKAKIWTLTNGFSGTVSCIALLTGLKEDTIRQRLANSNCHEKVLAKQTLKAKIYTLSDGTKTSVQEHASLMNISAEIAEQRLIKISTHSENQQESYKLSDGQLVTISDIVKIANISINTAKSRIKASLDTKIVLKNNTALIIPNSCHMFQCNKTGNLVKQSIFS